MRIFGFSFMTLFFFLVFFILGSKYPNALKSVPVINRI